MSILSTGTDYDTLAAHFRPLFARIAAGAADASVRVPCLMNHCSG